MTSLINMLIIEDNAGDVILCKRSLSRIDQNCRTYVCSNGKVALEYLNQTSNTKYQPNLIILDSSLPMLNGFQVLGRIKEMPLYKETCVVIFSCSNKREDIETYLEMGANDYIVKPMKLNLYDDAVKSIYDAMKKPKKENVLV